MYSVSVFYQLNSRTGLYTSPHMVSVRERIRINGVPLSEEDFAKYFFQVFEKLDKGDLVGDTALYRARCNQGFILQLQRRQDEVAKLNYFRALTLIAFHTFMSLKVSGLHLKPVIYQMSSKSPRSTPWF